MPPARPQPRTPRGPRRPDAVLPTRPPTKRELRAAIGKTPLGKFFAWIDEIKPADVRKLGKVIASADSERPVQIFLQTKPALLVRHLSGGHGRWVIPQQRFGSQYVADFLIADAHSFGRDWYVVELESPTAQMFKKSGDASATLQKAISQIQRWRVWLKNNLDYAKRPRGNDGLGLVDIRPDLAGYVIVGRRADIRGDTHELRRQIMQENNIEIHTYDWLLDAAGGEVDWFGTPLGQKELRGRRRGN